MPERQNPSPDPKSPSERTLYSPPNIDTRNSIFILLSNNPDTINIAQGYMEVGIQNRNLVLVDVNSIGLEPIAKVRREFPNITIIAISNYQWSQEPNPAARAIYYGADQVIKGSDPLAVQIEYINAVLRKKESVPDRIIQIGEIQINLGAGTTTKNQEYLKLSRTEWKLLSLLSKNLGEVITRNQILTDVWGNEYANHYNVLRPHISRLRAKIGRDLIETVPGEGYKLVNDIINPQSPHRNQD